MEWNKLCVTVESMAMDPGIVTNDSFKTEFARADLKKNMRLNYNDPSSIMASLTVKSFGDDGVTLLVSKREERISDTEWHRLDRGGRDYCNFELYVWLE